MNKENIFTCNYVILDVETTGLEPINNDIIEFSAIRINGNRIIENEHFYVKTNKEITNRITSLNGIDTQILEEKGISQQKAAQKIFSFIKDDVLVAHYASFDEKFIRDIFEKNNYLLKNQWICTWALAKSLIASQNYKLSEVAKTLNIDYDENLLHKAQYDVSVTKKVFYKLFNILKRKHPQITSYKDLNKFINLQNSWY